MTIYYVDATLGNDGATGTTELTAWQTITKVNGYTFQADDQILLKRGETWVGVKLVVPRSNLTFASYGSGANPIIDGNDLVDCFEISNKNNITITNIEITQGLDFGFYVHFNATNITIRDCSAHDCGNDQIIFIDGVSNSRIENCEAYNGYQRVGGTLVTGIEIADGSYDIAITDVNCHDNAGAGIAIISHVATTMPYNITITGANCHINDDFGIKILKQDNNVEGDRAISISDSQFDDNTAGSGFGINMESSVAAKLNGVQIDNSQAFDNGSRPLIIDNSQAVLITRCGLNDTTDLRIVDSADVTLYNLTVVQTNAVPFDIRGTTDGVLIRNCIFTNASAGAIAQVITTTNVDIDYCLYFPNGGAAGVQWRWGAGWNNWANWLINSGQDANSPVPTDPLFVNPSANDFHLQAGSPAIDTGVDVGLPYMGDAPDIGALEFPVRNMLPLTGAG